MTAIQETMFGGPTWLKGLPRKVTDDDLMQHPELRKIALDWTRDYTGTFDYVLDCQAEIRRNATLSLGQLRGLLNCLRAELRRPVAAKAQSVEPGIYKDADGSLVKVQQNKAKTRVYALVWTDITGTRLTLDGGTAHGEWRYQPGLISRLRPEQHLTLDEAKQFTLIYGQCVRCGRRLKDAQSIEQGMGPICVKYFTAFDRCPS